MGGGRLYSSLAAGRCAYPDRTARALQRAARLRFPHPVPPNRLLGPTAHRPATFTRSSDAPYRSVDRTLLRSGGWRPYTAPGGGLNRRCIYRTPGLPLGLMTGYGYVPRRGGFSGSRSGWVSVPAWTLPRPRWSAAALATRSSGWATRSTDRDPTPNSRHAPPPASSRRQSTVGSTTSGANR